MTQVFAVVLVLGILTPLCVDSAQAFWASFCFRYWGRRKACEERGRAQSCSVWTHRTFQSNWPESTFCPSRPAFLQQAEENNIKTSTVQIKSRISFYNIPLILLLPINPLSPVTKKAGLAAENPAKHHSHRWPNRIKTQGNC